MSGVSVDLFGLAVTRQWIPIGRTTPRGGPPARPGVLLSRVDQIVVGDTGMKGLRARDAARDIGQAFGHFLADDLDIIECVPAITSAVGRVEEARFFQTRRGAPTDDDPQAKSIFVNLCFGGPIDPKAAYARWDPKAAYANWVDLTARLCVLFGLQPDPDKPPILVRAGGSPDEGGLDPSRNDPDLALHWVGETFETFTKSFADALAALEAKPAADAASRNPEPRA